MANERVTIVYAGFQTVGNHVSYPVATSTPIAVPAGANALLVQAVGAACRMKLDGNAPSATQGFQIATGQMPVMLIIFPGNAPPNVIQETATATFEVQPVSQPT